MKINLEKNRLDAFESDVVTASRVEQHEIKQSKIYGIPAL